MLLKCIALFCNMNILSDKILKIHIFNIQKELEKMCKIVCPREGNWLVGNWKERLMFHSVPYHIFLH